MSSILKPLLNSHLWHIMEELTFQAFLIQYLVVIWFFASREQNTLLSNGYILQVTVSSCILSYLISIPFYLLVERPFKNFLDLILFPKSSIFKKQKDLDDDDDSTSSDEDEKNVTKRHSSRDKAGKNGKKQEILCGFCQDEAFFSTLDGVQCDCKCLITKKKCKCIDKVAEKDSSMILSPQSVPRRELLAQRAKADQVSDSMAFSLVESQKDKQEGVQVKSGFDSEIEKQRAKMYPDSPKTP